MKTDKGRGRKGEGVCWRGQSFAMAYKFSLRRVLGESILSMLDCLPVDCGSLS